MKWVSNRFSSYRVGRSAAASVLLFALAGLSGAGSNYIGYHGPNGTQVYPNSNPPVEWDGKTGTNILWQTPLPYVSYGGLIAVKNRVFLMSEFGYQSDFPELVCMDATTGKRLWKREINHLALAVQDAAERQKVATVWHDHLAWRREYMTLKAELAGAADEAARAVVTETMKTKGMWTADKKATPEKASPLSHWRMGKEHPEIGKAGLFFDAWRGSYGGWWPGATFATPCSDGEFVYIATAWRQYACFDFNGNQKWLQWFPQGGGRPGKSADYGDGCGGSRSPLLWGDLFIADTFGWVRALDRKTGKVVWEVSRDALGIGQHEITSPVVMTIGGVDVLWCNGPLAIRLPEGKPLKVENWPNSGMMAVLNTDERDTLFLTGGGEHGAWADKGHGTNPPPAAVKFMIEGDALKPTVLWSGIDGKGLPSNCATLAYDAGKVYYCNRGVQVLDAKTGKVLSGAAKKAAAATGSIYAIANGRIYGTGAGGEHGCEKRKDDLEAKVSMDVFSLDGKQLAVNALYGPKLEGEFKTMQTVAGIPNWFSYSMPFTVDGDRLYVRGCWMVYCIGAK